MKLSQNGLDLIMHFEGLRLQAYQDAVGVWTIGYGHTASARRGMRISPAEARALLMADVMRFEQGVNNWVTAPINQDQFDALVSFSLNVGVSALRNSTLLKLLNAGQMDAAAVQFLRWNKAGGKVLPGLTRRRGAEAALFSGMDWRELIK